MESTQSTGRTGSRMPIKFAASTTLSSACSTSTGGPKISPCQSRPSNTGFRMASWTSSMSGSRSGSQVITAPTLSTCQRLLTCLCPLWSAPWTSSAPPALQSLTSRRCRRKHPLSKSVTLGTCISLSLPTTIGSWNICSQSWSTEPALQNTYFSP